MLLVSDGTDWLIFDSNALGVEAGGRQSTKSAKSPSAKSPSAKSTKSGKG